MASQLLPLELIDRCVGSPIWVIMKGDKGKHQARDIFKHRQLTMVQNSVALSSASMTSSVCRVDERRAMIHD